MACRDTNNGGEKKVKYDKIFTSFLSWQRPIIDINQTLVCVLGVQIISRKTHSYEYAEQLEYFISIIQRL